MSPDPQENPARSSYPPDPSYRPAVAAARLKWFKEGEWPASTYLVVSALALPTMLVEVEAVAMV